MTTPLTGEEAQFLADLAHLDPETRAAFLLLLDRMQPKPDFSIIESSPVVRLPADT